MEFSFAVVIIDTNGVVWAVIPQVHKPIPGREIDIMEKWIDKRDPDYFEDMDGEARGDFRYTAQVVKLTFDY